MVALAYESAQGQAPSTESGSALLQEVRQLRVAIENLTATTARAQIILGRLQIQEQRLDNAIRRLGEARSAIAEMERATAARQERLTRLRHAAANASDPEEREAAEVEAQSLAREIAGDASRLSAARLQESDLASSVSRDQGVWSGLNSGLDELDRDLRPR